MWFIELIICLIMFIPIFCIGIFLEKKEIHNYKDNMKNIFTAIGGTTITTVLSYTLIMFRYFYIYKIFPANINIEDILNIMYRSIPYLVIILILSIIFELIIHLIEKLANKKEAVCYIIMILFSYILSKLFDKYFFKGYFVVIYSALQLSHLKLFYNFNLKDNFVDFIIKRLIILVVLLPFISVSIPEKFYKVITKENHQLEGILVSDLKDKIKLIPEKIEKDNFKIIEIPKEGIIEINEIKNKFLTHIPECKEDVKKICLYMNRDIIKINLSENGNTTHIITKLNINNEEDKKILNRFNFIKNKNYSLKMYSISEKKLIEKTVKYVEKYCDEKDVIYLLESIGNLSIVIENNSLKNKKISINEQAFIIIEESK